MDIEWVVDHGDNRKENWVGTESGFTRVTCVSPTSSTSIDLNTDDTDGLCPKFCRSHYCGLKNQAFPSSFTYCTDCGKLLAPWNDDEPNGYSLNGSSDDWPEIIVLPDIRNREPEEFPLPAGGDFFFALGGAPLRLIAIDPMSGAINLFSEVRQAWFEVPQARSARVPRWSLPRWGWAACGSAAGVILPSDFGPYRLSLADPLAPMVEPLQQTSMRYLAGAAFFDRTVLVPVAHGQEVRLAAIPDQSGSAELLPVGASSSAVEIGNLGAPVRNADGSVFWAPVITDF